MKEKEQKHDNSHPDLFEHAAWTFTFEINEGVENPCLDPDYFRKKYERPLPRD